MSLSPVQPSGRPDFSVEGDVRIHESAIVAPGAILKAAPGSRIALGPGACVGMGTILSAERSGISIGAGAIVGTGVLIVGSSEIGADACIGSTTTIYNASIEQGAIVPPGSRIGDSSRQVTLEVEGRVAGDEDPRPAEVHTPRPVTEDSPDRSVVGKVYINQLLFTLFPERRHFNGTDNRGA